MEEPVEAGGLVIGKRRAVAETVAPVECERRFERRAAAGFEAEPPEATSARGGNDPVQKCRGSAQAQRAAERAGDHQASTRRPMTAPAAVTMPMAMPYQVSMKSGESSMQWKA